MHIFSRNKVNLNLNCDYSGSWLIDSDSEQQHQAFATVHARKSRIKHPEPTRGDWGIGVVMNSHRPVDTQMQMPCHPKFSFRQTQICPERSGRRNCSPNGVWKIHTPLLPRRHPRGAPSSKTWTNYSLKNSTVWTQHMHFDGRELRQTNEEPCYTLFLYFSFCLSHAHTHTHTHSHSLSLSLSDR